MKITKVINLILLLISFVFGFIGVLLIIGSPGALEQGTITVGQLIRQEIFGFLSSGISFIVYIIREFFNYTFTN